MTLAEAIKRIDKSDDNKIDWILSENLFDSIGLDYWNFDINRADDNPKISAYYLKNNYCTDQWVGTIIYFLDDEPICLSEQPYRKSPVEFEWFSKEAVIKTKEYLETLRNEINQDNITYTDINQEIGEGYSIEYYGGLLNHHIPKRNPTVNGIPVESITPNKNKDFGIAFDIDVKTTDGEVYEKVPMSIINFEYNLIPKGNL